MASIRKIRKQAERARIRTEMKDKAKRIKNKIAIAEFKRKSSLREVKDYLGFSKFKKTKHE